MWQWRQHHGIRHAPECRERLEHRAREEQEPRITRENARRVRYENEIIEREEAQLAQPGHSEGGVSEGTPAENFEDFDDATTRGTGVTPPMRMDNEMTVRREGEGGATSTRIEGDDEMTVRRGGGEDDMDIQHLDKETRRTTDDQEPNGVHVQDDIKERS